MMIKAQHGKAVGMMVGKGMEHNISLTVHGQLLLGGGMAGNAGGGGYHCFGVLRGAGGEEDCGLS